MTLGVAESWATIIGTAFALGVPLLISFVTARSTTQRGLRDQLRKQLRGLDLICHVHLRREGWQAVNPMPTISLQALDHIYQDGLLSPCYSHIEAVQDLLRDVHRRIEAVDTPPPDAESIFQAPAPRDTARVDQAMEALSSAARSYLRAIGKMDNAGVGGYFTYLRYRFDLPWRQPLAKPTGE